MTTTVLVTLLNDPRARDAVDSALLQGPGLAQVLVADGGSRPHHLAPLKTAFAHDPRVRIIDAPGSVAETRNQALREVTTPVVAFLDADERAPPSWLTKLTRPILDGHADFTGGPTEPLGPARSPAERYTNQAEARLYRDDVPRDLALLPMGNSAWRVDLLRRIGGFDARLFGGGEDYDVNLRALRSGARGLFVPDAVLWHDQSHLDTFGKVLRRKRRYYAGAAAAYLKNGRLQERAGAAAKRFRVYHPIDLLDVALKPWALLQAKRLLREP